MASIQRKEQLKNFLQRFDQNPILFPNNINDLGKMGEFLLAYLGNCFIEGYRLIEKIGHNMFLLSLMNVSRAKKQIGENISEFKLVCVQFEEKTMEERSVRAEKYKDINEIMKFFCLNDSEKHVQGIDITFVFAKTFMVSKQLTLEALQKCSSLSLKNFYNRDYKIFKKGEVHNGLKVLSEVEQGKKLHELVEMYIKGSGSICNQKYVAKSVFHHSKFGYNVQKVINTVCLIIGKEMIQGGFVSMSSEKWMRKFSEKKFKRFDLLLRNEKKVCIIDWKFSKVNANEKINTQQFATKNKQYFQLARKQYNAEVELKFYCFNQNFTNHYHQYSFANYHYDIDKVEINDHEYFTSECNQIQIQDSDDEKKVQVFPQNQKTARKKRKGKRFEEDQNGSSDDHCDVIIDSSKRVFEWKRKSRQEVQSENMWQKYSNEMNDKTMRVNERKGVRECDISNRQVYQKENKIANIIDLNNEDEFNSFSNSLEIINQNCSSIINIEDEPIIETKPYHKNKQQMAQQIQILLTQQKSIKRKQKNGENMKAIQQLCSQGIQEKGKIIQIQEIQKRSEEIRIGQGQLIIMESSQKQINIAQVQCQEILSLTQNLKIKPFQIVLTYHQPPIITNNQSITQPPNQHILNNNQDNSISNRSHTKQGCNQQIFVNSQSESIKENRNKNDFQKPAENSLKDAFIERSIPTFQNMEIQTVTDLKKEREKIIRKVREIQRQAQKEERQIERPKYKSRTILYVDSQTKHNSFIRPKQMIINTNNDHKSIIDLEDNDCVVID